MIGPIIIVVIAFALIGSALWLLSLARNTERAEGVLQRIQTSSITEETDLPTATNRRLQNPIVRRIVQLFWRAGRDITPSQALLVMLLMALMAVLSVAIAGLVLGGIIGGLILALAYFIVDRLAAHRRRKIVEQLPEFLESVIRVLAAGNSLEESFTAAARECADPIRPLFLSVARQVKLGASVDQVLTEVGLAYRLRDLRVLGLASNVNRRYGGSIRAVLRSMVVTVRQRLMAERELRALTGETRFSAFVLAGVPIGLSLFIYSRNARYYATMYQDPSGKIMLIAAVILQIVGAFVLWRMLNSTGGPET